ncbi:MAG: hypothetical protein ACK5RL_03170 [Acidimicrobiales bacterium]
MSFAARPGRPDPPPVRYTIRSQRTSLWFGCAALVGALAIVLMLLALVFALFPGVARWAVIPAVALLGSIAVPMALAARRAAAWERGQIDLPAAPLLLGTTTEIPFRIRSKRRAVAPGFAATALLSCWEKATSYGGTDSYTATEAVHEACMPILVRPTDHGVEAMIRLTIPVDEGGPTLDLTSNEIDWVLAVTIAARRLPAVTETFPLQVWATVDPVLIGDPPLPSNPLASDPLASDPLASDHPAGDRPPSRNQGPAPRNLPSGGRQPDPLVLSVESGVAELGGRIRGQLIRTANAPTGSGLFLELRYRTEGRGTPDEGQALWIQLPDNTMGPTAYPFDIVVPTDVPISYDGRLIRVVWELRATISRRLRPDADAVVPILVAPHGGRGLYRQPHPLPPGQVPAPW